MSLVEHRDEGIRQVRWVRQDAILTDLGEHGSSFLLAPDSTAIPWAPRSVEQIDEDAIGSVLALQPALVLLGTGSAQRMPAPKVLAGFLRHGIGIEAMDNAAAARTFNLLASEGRRVIVAFLLPD